MKRTLAVLATATAAAAGTAVLAAPAHAAPGGPSKSLVIARVFGGGGNSGSHYSNDFVEIYNPTASTISLAGWSLQYASSSGSVQSTDTTALTGSIQSGHYFLFEGNDNAPTGSFTALPTPDQVNTNFSISSTNATVFLVDQPGTTTTTIASPTDSAIIDEVGTGTSADFEGKATPAMSNVTWVTREATVAGSTVYNGDTDNNANDFVVEAADGTIAPRNSATTSTTTPPPALPEASLAIGLPIVGVAVAGGVLARRRRRAQQA